MTSRRRAPWLVATALLALAIGTYAGVAGCGFLHFDDDLFVTGNPFVRQGLSLRAVRWAFEAGLLYLTPYTDYWLPLTALSRMLDVQLFGMNPTAQHLVNLLLHGANVLLLFALLRFATGALWRSAFVAAVLAVHPLHVEAVAWVTARKDVLCGFFWLGTLAAYVGWAHAPSRKRWALVVLLFACALMSKPMAATLPFVLLLLDYWPLGRLTDGPRLARGLRLLREKGALFALSAASVAVTIASKPTVSFVARDRLPLSARLGNALDAYVSYLTQAFWPVDLAVGYPHAEGGLPWSRLLVCSLVLALLTSVALLARRPYLIVGWLWFLGVLVPTIGLVQSGVQSRADRFSYLPLVGISLALAWAAGEWAAGAARRRLVIALCAALTLLLLARETRAQVGYWHDDLSLFTHATAVLPTSVIAHNGLGAALARAGELDRAEAEYRAALARRRDTVLVLRNLSALLASRGRDAEAQALLEDALRRPDRAPDEMAELHFALGRLEARWRRNRSAEAHYAEALRFDPRHWAALYNLGNLLAAEGRLDEAAERYAAAQRLNPDDVDVSNNLGLALLLTARPAQAVERLSAAVAIDPGLARGHVSLGRALVAAGRPEQGTAELREAVALAPASSEAHFQLAEVLASRGFSAEAQQHYREAVRLDPDDPLARARLAGAEPPS
jgi:protein O-mannosyl-transferase